MTEATTTSLNRPAGALAAPSLAVAPQLQRAPRTLWGDAWRRFRRHRLAMTAACILTLVTLICLLGPTFYTKDPKKIDFLLSMKPPSADFWLGTDDLGRDMLARLMLGGRISLAVGVAAMAVAMSLGTLIGATAGFFGGRIDNLLMRITDLFLALPVVPLLLLLIFLFRDRLRQLMGPEMGIFWLIITVIGILNWMTVARLVRGSFLSLKEREFVEAATCLGVSRWSIMFRHILPNTMGPIIVAATLSVGAAIITESVLSFLGLGFPPDTPTWGRLLFDGQNFLDLAPWMVLFPGFCIFITVLSINFMGDGLRDALDPRQRQ